MMDLSNRFYSGSSNNGEKPFIIRLDNAVFVYIKDRAFLDDRILWSYDTGLLDFINTFRFSESGPNNESNLWEYVAE